MTIPPSDISLQNVAFINMQNFFLEKLSFNPKIKRFCIDKELFIETKDKYEEIMRLVNVINGLVSLTIAACFFSYTTRNLIYKQLSIISIVGFLALTYKSLIKINNLIIEFKDSTICALEKKNRGS